MSENIKPIPAKSEEQQFAQMVLETFQSSGLSVKQFCKNEGIPEWKFYHWRRTLKSGTADAKIIPAALSDKPLPKFVRIAQTLPGDSAVRIEFPSGISIHVSSGLLREAIDILRC
jgi:hypothetical protein